MVMRCSFTRLCKCLMFQLITTRCCWWGNHCAVPPGPSLLGTARCSPAVEAGLRPASTPATAGLRCLGPPPPAEVRADALAGRSRGVAPPQRLRYGMPLPAAPKRSAVASRGMRATGRNDAVTPRRDHGNQHQQYPRLLNQIPTNPAQAIGPTGAPCAA